MSKPGRNDPCPCGSGKKYKQCCLHKQGREQPAPSAVTPEIRQAMQMAMPLHQAGRLAEAEAIYRQVLRQSPREPDALHLLGLLSYQRKDYPAALELIGRAISYRHTEPGYFVNLGLVHEALQHVDEAIACYRKALALQPDIAEANCNLGGILANQMKLEEAINLCRRALAVKPGLAEAWCNLGLAYSYHDNLDLAVDTLNKALQYMPACAQAYRNLGIVYGRQSRPDQAIACFEQALALRPDDVAVYDSLFYTFLYCADYRPETVREAYRRYAARLEAPLRPGWPRHDNRRDPDRRLKIGYVSPDFRLHSVAFFVEPLFACHDHGAFEIHAYYNHGNNDAVTARLRALTDHWVDCRNMSDNEIAARIHADGIDILVDLAGHSANNRLPVFARKPAPIQVTWLGYPATTGLTAIDWRLTTADVDPPGSERDHSERLWRLPRTLWCYRPSAGSPERQTRKDVSSGQGICFGSMNTFPKVSVESIALWARILRQLPDSHLAMTHIPVGSARELMLERFAAHGIGPERLRLHGKLPFAEFRALTNDIDIALDPFPYNGTTTTCESLWLGIPVVTLTGNSSVSRSGHALLKTVGLAQLCARDEDEYESIALALARDPARLHELRAGMRHRVEASPLRDEQGFARDVEDAYRAMWRQWCGTSPGPGG